MRLEDEIEDADDDEQADQEDDEDDPAEDFEHGECSANRVPVGPDGVSEMLKVLDPRTHGALDYLLAIAFLVAPGLFGFPYPAAPLSYIIGVVYLGTSLLTKYPLGAVKLIPFPVHGILEAIMAAAWIVMPWLFGFGFHDAARNFYVIAGVGLLAVVVLTDYRSSGARTYSGQERRHSLVDRRQRALTVRSDRRRAGIADRRRYAAA
jgi:hypothetical protein